MCGLVKTEVIADRIDQDAKWEDKKNFKSQRPRSAFSYYIADVLRRKVFLSLKEASQSWKGLSSEQKDFYIKEQNEDMRRYARESGKHLFVFSSKKWKKFAIPLFNFCKQRRPELIESYPELPEKEINLMIGNEWNQMTLMQRLTFLNKNARRDKPRRQHGI